MFNWLGKNKDQKAGKGGNNQPGSQDQRYDPRSGQQRQQHPQQRPPQGPHQQRPPQQNRPPNNQQGGPQGRLQQPLPRGAQGNAGPQQSGQPMQNRGPQHQQQGRPQNPSQRPPERKNPGPPGKPVQSSAFERPPTSVSGVTVYFDTQTIRCVQSNGDIETLRWDQLAGVLILISSEGPYAYDMHWVMAGQDDGGCIFPNTAAGASDIIRYMQDNLKGFNNGEIIKAMNAKENGKYVIWKG